MYSPMILSIFLVAVLIFGSANGASFDGEIGTHTKSVGDDVQLDCTVKDYNEDLTFVWYRQGVYESEMIALGDMKVVPGKNMKVEITKDEAANRATSTIKITEMTFSDFGKYDCAIQGAGVNGQKISGEITRAQSEVPDPVIQVSKEPNSPKQGQSVKLICHVTSYAGNSMLWFKLPEKSHLSADMISAGPMVLLDQTKYTASLSQNGETVMYTLVINTLSSSDSGVYKCQAQVLGQDWDKNPSGTVKLSVGSTSPITTSKPIITTTAKPTLSPQIPATITNTIGVISAVHGNNVNLACVIKNRRGHEVTWSKMLGKYAHLITKGLKIEHQKRHHYGVAFTGDTYRLTVKSVTAEDGGKYRCSVIGNSDGSIPMMEGYLLIEPKVSGTGISIQNALGTQDVAAGSTAVFSCEVKNLSSKGGQIFWLFASDNAHTPNVITMGSLVLTPNKKYSVTTSTQNDDVTISKLNIANVSVAEEGIYRCMVQDPNLEFDDHPKADGLLTVV
ncbi:protein amalgam-like [Lineus longissimus]|uniref:protein amalgam-like n=1 Tax=Lineus longissimus TaxID=88925 RepID=UPI002B4DB1DC